ncbi:MAG: hypothetical protein RIE73_03465 [Coleofasciculus sp. C1-SOL-03]|jgi:hypothetical protein|uniref:hypothetical protein n=1 Tax=Coleofasciculus sp. C1-SOL-03 TaxID=3069522 RepID=UPI0032F160E0
MMPKVLIDVSTAIAVDSREEDAGFVKFFGRLAKKVSLWGKLFLRERKRVLNHAVS